MCRPDHLTSSHSSISPPPSPGPGLPTPGKSGCTSPAIPNGSNSRTSSGPAYPLGFLHPRFNPHPQHTQRAERPIPSLRCTTQHQHLRIGITAGSEGPHWKVPRRSLPPPSLRVHPSSNQHSSARGRQRSSPHDGVWSPRTFDEIDADEAGKSASWEKVKKGLADVGRWFDKDPDVEGM